MFLLKNCFFKNGFKKLPIFLLTRNLNKLKVKELLAENAFLAGYFLISISINFEVKKPEKYCQPFPHPNLYKTGKKKSRFVSFGKKTGCESWLCFMKLAFITNLNKIQTVFIER